MPSTDTVERLHERLVNFGDEPTVAAERGEAIEPPIRPESNIDDDLSALLGDAIAQGSEEEENPSEGVPPDPFAEVSLGDDDFPVPPDYSFDPEAIPDTIEEEGALPEEVEAEVPGDEVGGETLDLGTLDDVAAEDSDAEELGADEFDVGELGDLGDLGDLDEGGEFGDLAELGDLEAEEGVPVDESEEAETPTDELIPQDFDAEDIGTADFDAEDSGADEFGADEFDVGELGDLGDLGDIEEGGEFGDLAELGDLEAEEGVPVDEGDEAETPTDELAPQDLDTQDFGTADFDTEDSGPDEFGADDFDVGDLGELGDLGDLDEGGEFGDLAELGDLEAEEGVPVDESEEAETPTDELAPQDLDAGDIGEADLDAADFGADEFGADEFDVGELGDLGDLGEPTDDLGVADEEDFEGLSDLDEAAESIETGTDAFGADEFEGADETFGSDFGNQVDQEFGDIDLDEESISADPFADGGADAFELPAVEESLDNLEDEGFSLGDFGDAFDIDEESMDDFAGLDTGAVETIDEDLGEEVPEAVDLSERSFSDEDFSHIKRTLGSLPLNVRIAVEECIGEPRGSSGDVLELINLLIAGETPQKIAAHVSRATGTAVQVPKGYQRRSGISFEEEKRSFRYQFVHVILPFLRVAVALTVVSAIVGISLYRFVYKPVYAGVLYRRGYQDIQEERYDLAEDTFSRAYDLRPRDSWFKRYAEAFVAKREYDRAVEKYDQLVFGMNEDLRRILREYTAGELYAGDRLGDTIRYTDPANPRRGFEGRVYDLLTVDREALLDHAGLQSERLANYRRAEELYSILLFGSAYDAETLLATGDNYYRWADIDPSRLEDSYRSFESYLFAHGPTDEVMMRFLRHYIRTDNHRQVHRIVEDVQSRSAAVVDARIYANAADYLLDKAIAGNALEPPIDIRTVLVKAFEQNREQPEIQYVDARNRRRLSDPVGERAALDEARRLFELAEPLDPDQLVMQIDTDILSGEYYLIRGETLTADEEFDRAQRGYDRAKEAGLLDPDAKLARVYELRGDVLYYGGGDLTDALDYYERAAVDGRSNDRLSYKRGFIHYEHGEFDTAIGSFLDAWRGNGFSGPENVLYARANTFFRREVYSAAEAYYRELLRRLAVRRDAIDNLLIEEDPAQRALIEMTYKVENNLGVTLHRLASIDSTRANVLLPEALNHLRMSTELYENYLRDPDTGVRADSRSLAFLNLRNALYPQNDPAFQTFELEIHESIPRDEVQLRF